MAVDVRIVWDDEAASEMRWEYLSEVEGLEPGSEWPALHLVQLGPLGELSITVDGAQLFVAPYEVIQLPEGVNILGLLLGLRFALDRLSEHGNQVLSMSPDWMPVFVEPEPNGLVSVWSPSGNVLRAPLEDWSLGLDRGLAETRQYLGEHLPELRDDPLLGDWMKGAEPAYFKGVCFSEQDEPPQFRRVLPQGYVPPATHHPPVDESFIEFVCTAFRARLFMMESEPEPDFKQIAEDVRRHVAVEEEGRRPYVPCVFDTVADWAERAPERCATALTLADASVDEIMRSEDGERWSRLLGKLGMADARA